MRTQNPSLESRLRGAAALLLSLPAIVAAACFAHGHGALGSIGLLAILAVAIAAGAIGAYRLLSPLRSNAAAPRLPHAAAPVVGASSRH